MEHSFKLAKSRQLNSLTAESYFLNPHKRQSELQETSQSAYKASQFYLYGGCEKVGEKMMVHSLLKQSGVWNEDETFIQKALGA